MSELYKLSARTIVSLIRNKKLKSTEVMEALIGLSNQFDDKLKVWETFDPQLALENSKSIDSNMAKGLDEYSLLGVPVGIKDIIYTKDQLTTFGSKIYSQFINQHINRCLVCSTKICFLHFN